MDPSTFEGILILKFYTNLWSAQLIWTSLQEEENDRNSLCTPWSASTLTTASGSSRSSSGAAVNIFEDTDENNADEEDADFAWWLIVVVY